MEEARGDRPMAAAFLGMTCRKLHDLIDHNRELKARWTGALDAAHNPAPVISEVGALSKPRSMSTVDETLEVPIDAKLLLDQMENEDRQLRDGLVRINLTPAEADIAAELALFHRQHFVKSIHIIGAGVTRMSIKVQTQLANIEKRVSDVQGVLSNLQSEDRESWVSEERMLYQSYHALADLLRQMFEIANQSALQHADIMFRMKGGRPQNSKPGFSDE